MRTAGLAVLAAAILSQGCAPPYRIAPRTVFFTPDSAADPYWAKAQPRDPKAVAATEGDLARPHTKMGRLKVESTGLDTNLSIDRLRLEAAQRGLDAVVLVKVSKTSTGGSSNEAINYFFPPVVRHAVEGVGVLFAETAPAQAPPAPSAPPLQEPAPSPPLLPTPPPPLPTPPPPPADTATAPPVVETPPALAPAAPQAPPPPSPSPSKYAPLPPPDVFTDERK